MSTTTDHIRQIVLRLLEADERDLTETSLFAEDHGADSMMIIQIQSELECELDIVIAREEVPRMIHLKALREVVARAVAAKEAARAAISSEEPSASPA
ncbi:acyl carrier protein [Kitasatospora sp. NPDC048722]|uniref:acyl carrier protein n=1 Tax=Kitasatospora sp. NPDC048722 TaxID=3155639 RepID=UPI0033E92523